MIMNARHSLAQLNDSRDTGVHYGVFTGRKLFNDELFIQDINSPNGVSGASNWMIQQYLCPHWTMSSLRANNIFFNNILLNGGVSPLTLMVSNDLICWCITHVCCLFQFYTHTHTHTHTYTHTYIYIYIYMHVHTSRDRSFILTSFLYLLAWSIW